MFRRLLNRRWKNSIGTLSSLHQKFITMNTLVSRVLGEEMKKLEDLAKKSLATRIFDHEEYKSSIQQIFQRVNDATTSFHVCALIFISGYVCTHRPFPDRNGDQHPEDSKSDTR